MWLWECFRVRSMLLVEQIVLLMWVGLVQSVEGLNRPKMPTFPQVRWNFSCLNTSPGTSVFACLQNPTQTLTFFGSQVCQPSNWNYAIGFPRSPACCWLQIWGLVSLHNWVSQFLMLNKSINKHTHFLCILLLWRILTNIKCVSVCLCVCVLYKYSWPLNNIKNPQITFGSQKTLLIAYCWLEALLIT